MKKRVNQTSERHMKKQKDTAHIDPRRGEGDLFIDLCILYHWDRYGTDGTVSIIYFSSRSPHYKEAI